MNEKTRRRAFDRGAMRLDDHFMRDDLMTVKALLTEPPSFKVIEFKNEILT